MADAEVTEVHVYVGESIPPPELEVSEVHVYVAAAVPQPVYIGVWGQI